MAIHPLPVYSEEEELDAIAKLQPPKTLVIRYGYMKQIAELAYDGTQVMGCGTKLVVRTTRGVEIAEMLTTTCSNSGCNSSVSRQQMLDYIENSGGKQYPFTTEGKVLRVAEVDDLNEWSRLQNDKLEYARAAKQAVKDLNLPMKIVEVEPMFSRDRIVFYFTSESRIDFRELVRRLAKELHVRVEMRQVGARDEARLVADYEKCGQQCCCKGFLKVLKPISMRSAKIQKATLDPSKISGRCGRLMCCLRYEDETYDDLRKRLPHRNKRVMTEDGPGTVINSQILTQLVLVELDDRRQRNAYPVENIEVLTGEASKRPKPDQLESKEPRGRGERSGRGERIKPRRKDNDAAGEDQQNRGQPARPTPGKPLNDDEVESKEGIQASDVSGANPDASQSDGKTDTPADDQPPKKKRRRRRGRRGRGKGNRPGEGGGSSTDNG